MELNKILEELEKYKNTNKNEVFASYVQKRLNASLKTYYNELEKSFSYLYDKNDLKLLKKINKEQNNELD